MDMYKVGVQYDGLETTMEKLEPGTIVYNEPPRRKSQRSIKRKESESHTIEVKDSNHPTPVTEEDFHPPLNDIHSMSHNPIRTASA